MLFNKKTLVLGASGNTNRYSYLALKRLRAHGYSVEGIGREEVKVGDVLIHTNKPPFEGIDTVTLYLSPAHQREYYDYILSLHPRRIIFNPGAENDELAELARANNIYPQEACTLVLLSTGQY
ncbi:CoA-binding protein [Flavihumibacter profundi]|uniref:CoA-binding protein n=1 Tax=Flavihumibacter profundi TaxID=2716883 RepID=UPI001CC4AAFA|nr:CoA-binding protein [Flavihumibacter profundi]MBZ5858205.1 CoA-binding protein [Flavihumibacter profundi]